MITCVWGVVALAIALLLVARISRGMLEREQRSLQIEKNRASALEAELARQRAERALVLNQGAVPHDFRRLAARHRDARSQRHLARTQPGALRDAR